MCQIVILTKTSQVRNQPKLLRVVSKALQKTMHDGFGYAIQGKRGVFGERTILPKFNSMIGKPTRYVDFKIGVQASNLYGTPSECQGAGIFHGRVSTNTKSLLNTHPIVRNGWHLIHNGVVTNQGKTYDKVTSNDSEDLVHYLSTQGIKGIEENLTGYYAVGAIDPKGNLHVIKDSMAHLYVAEVYTLNCLIFATTQDLIESVSKSMEWAIGAISIAKDDVYLVFDKRGQLVSNTEIKPLGWTNYEAQYGSTSLGWDPYDDGYDSWHSRRHPKLESVPDTTTVTPEESEELFVAETNTMDESYTVTDWNGRKMTIAEFKALDIVSKMDCVVRRADGTIVDPQDYYTDRIA